MLRSPLRERFPGSDGGRRCRPVVAMEGKKENGSITAALAPVIRVVILQELHFVEGHVLGRARSALGTWVSRSSRTMSPPGGQWRAVPEYWRPSHQAATTLMYLEFWPL